MDAEKLSQLTQKVIGDAAGAVGLLLAYIGDQSKVYTTTVSYTHLTLPTSLAV